MEYYEKSILKIRMRAMESVGKCYKINNRGMSGAAARTGSYKKERIES